MGNSLDAARSASDSAGLAARIEAALENRIGTDRYAVWFGRSMTVRVESAPVDRATVVAPRGRRSKAGDVATPRPPAGGQRVILRVGSGLTHEWLRRTFRSDVEAAVGDVCGPGAELVWEPQASPSSGPDSSPDSNHDSSRDSSRDSSEDQPPAADRRGGASARGTGKRAARARGERTVRADSAQPVRAKPAHGTRAEPAHGMRAESVRPGTPGERGDAKGREPTPGRSLADFVVGTSNRLACGAVELVASRPGEVSPLVIHGPSGVGKTHLLDGVCARTSELHPGASIVSLSAEQFTNGFLQSLHGSGLPGFRRTCRSADLLVIDDIHFLVGKRATLLEFQLTVDALHRQGRQMVFTCDRELDSLPGLGPELVTRLRGGMNAPILSPDYEVRRGIVAALCARRRLAVPDAVVHHVATHMTRHARELIGAVNRLEATSLMLGVDVTAEMAEEALADLVRSSARSVRLADVERAVCAAFGIEPGSLQSSRRARTVSQPRMLAMFLARKHTHAALTDIGRYFGRRSHSTVIAAQRTVGEWVARRSPVVLAETEWDVEEAIRRVEDLLRAG
jgi:chromosomal replication initiator protein